MVSSMICDQQGTAPFAWSVQTPAQREATLNDFCSTSCGSTYTATLAGRRRGCKPPTPVGKGAQVVPDGPAEFPSCFLGLKLGCVVDDVTGQFCALKKANAGDGGK